MLPSSWMLEFVDPTPEKHGETGHLNGCQHQAAILFALPLLLQQSLAGGPGWKSQVEGKKSSGLEVFRTVPWFSYGTGGYILLSNPRAEPAPWRRSACCLLWASCFCRKILNQPRNVRGRWGQVAQPNAKTENCEVIHSVENSKQSLSRIGRRRRDALSKVNRQSKSSRIKCPIQ